MRGAVRFLAIAAAVTAVAACSSKRDEARRSPAPTVAVPDAEPSPNAPAAERAPQPAPIDASHTAADAGAAPTPPAPTAPPTAADAPTNLQVLPRTWTRERVELYMKQRVARGLGVDCAHCHDRRDYAADSERKQRARAMIGMTNEINRDFFAGVQRVSCGTCHGGRPTPDGEK